MSNTCLVTRRTFFSKFILGRFVCSFVLLASLFLVPIQLCAQDSASSAMSVALSEIDGDGLSDATFENGQIKVIISSKTGAPSLYYLKGANFEENLYPPQVLGLGYSIEKPFSKSFEIDTPDGAFSGVGYKIEVESETKEAVVVKAIANVSADVDDNTPDSRSFGLVKKYTFFAEGYLVKVQCLVNNLKEKLIVVGDESKGALALSYGPGIFMDPFGPCNLLGLKTGGESEIFTTSDRLNEGAGRDAFIGAGIKDQYFCVLVECDQQIKINSIASKTLSVNERKRALDVNLIRCTLPKFNLGAKESRTFNFQIYAGPTILEELQKINRTKIADFGFLNTIMLKILRYFYSIFPNYGVAIILLTLLVRLVLYPLTHKQTKAMLKMQKLQPKFKDIQERFKNDPQKMNEEVMKLYAKNNVTPFSGCLPLFLQIPIIMALYNTFRIAVELRKAPFLWMSDLSKGDPYLILPIAIAALMYYQQGKSGMDSQQLQTMAFMPMMMFVITWSMPSGLLVYWFTSSVLGLLQQLIANNYMVSIKEE